MKYTIVVVLFFSIIVSSCQTKQGKQPLLPHVTGAMHDVVVIMSPQNWEGEAGEALRTEFEQPVPAIPQEEPLLNIIWMPHDAFTKVIKKQRNIVVTRIGSDYQAKVTYNKSMWANSQLVIQIMAPTKEAFVELFELNGNTITQSIQQMELERLMANYKKSQESAIRENLVKKHDLSLILPRGYKVNHEEENFVWLDNRYRNIIEGILVYYYPYTDTNTFTKEYLIAKRNAILKQYVPGETRGSYPTTEMHFPVETAEYELNNKLYTYEMRGLWNVVDGMAMGGPFISITQYDEVRKRIVTIDGFLFAPGEDKRNLLKRLEAVLYSINFTEENTAAEQ